MGQVRMLIGVEWEGSSLDGVATLQEFNQQLPSLPLTHFVSPAYLARGGDLATVIRAMQPGFKRGDELAVYATPWSSIHGSPSTHKPVNQARGSTSGTVAYDGIESQTDSNGSAWLSSFALADIEAYLNAGRLILDPLREALIAGGSLGEEAKIVGVRAAGWSANDVVAMAAAAQFTYDASAANASFCAQAAQDVNLMSPGQKLSDWKSLLQDLAKLWGPEVISNPTWMSNQLLVAATEGQGFGWPSPPCYIQGSKGRILEIPNLGMVLPIMSVTVLEAAILHRLAAPESQTFYLSTGVTQESAATWLPALTELLTRLLGKDGVRFETHHAAARAITTASPVQDVENSI